MILAALVVFLAAMPVHAEIRILGSPGGQVGPFLDLFERVRASGETVVIDGPCLSACTLVLSVVPNDRICVTRRAVLGFHAARSIDRRGRLYAEPEADTRLDPPPRRVDVAAAALARPRPRGDLSEMSLTRARVPMRSERGSRFFFDAFSSREPVATLLENATCPTPGS
jgi:hypothetical protein